MGQRAGLKAAPRWPRNHFDVNAARLPTLNALLYQYRGAVIRIVQDLDFQAICRVIQARAGVNDALGHVLFVVDGQLDGDKGPCLRMWRRGRRAIHAAGDLPREPQRVHAIGGKSQHAYGIEKL